MRPEYPFVPPRRHPNCLMLIVRLRGAPCRRRRRAFFARMHAEARRLGIVMSQRLGLCLTRGKQAQRQDGVDHDLADEVDAVAARHEGPGRERREAGRDEGKLAAAHRHEALNRPSGFHSRISAIST